MRRFNSTAKRYLIYALMIPGCLMALSGCKEAERVISPIDVKSAEAFVPYGLDLVPHLEAARQELERRQEGLFEGKGDAGEDLGVGEALDDGLPDDEGDTGPKADAEGSDDRAGTLEEEVKEPELLNFVDAHGEWYEVEVDPAVESHTYDWKYLTNGEEGVSYSGDERYYLRKGVDVSHHQGHISWDRVMAGGYDFAFVRMAYRGYGSEGNLNLDRTYRENIVGAQNAGLDVGVYIFSQAVNEDEAIEEADLLIKNLEGLTLSLPIVYDPELIKNRSSRTENVTGEQFTKNTVAFCERIREAGYEPMIYSNMYWEAFLFDMEVLKDYPVWYADYENVPQTPYHFTFWQYTDSGKVDGISGNADINVWFCER